MTSENTIANIYSNAFNKDYTADLAVVDLERLMNEATLAEIRHGTDSMQHHEMKRLIPVQDKLARAKLNDDPIFDQFGSLNVTSPRDD